MFALCFACISHCRLISLQYYGQKHMDMLIPESKKQKRILPFSPNLEIDNEKP